MLYHSLLAFAWAFFISVFAIPSIIQVALKKRLLDEPNSRTIHSLLIPRLGGLAIFAGIVSAITIFGKVENGIQQVLAGAVLIFFIGLKDDMVSVSVFKKFFVQVIATGIILFNADIRITDLQGIFGIYKLEYGMSYGITFLFIIGVTNAINLIDGLDGLAGIIISIISFTLGVYFFIFGMAPDYPFGLLAFAMLGGIVGFLRYNFHKAIIFMGDAGSLVCGFIIAVLVIKFIEMRPVHNSAVLGFAIIVIPVLDTLRVFFLRLVAGVSPFLPDRNHLHHRFILLGFTQIGSVAILAVINIIAILGIQIFSFLPVNYLFGLLLTYGILISIIVEIMVRSRRNTFSER
ncbi:MAG TPA: MraY family glycosyltransferase [Cytophagaceae bacterium]|jgi:UDP-N-acetylmuramyl pentapeptide phosphotransferase/UDP-N-acetylglucosamine-1-phosphate transferase